MNAIVLILAGGAAVALLLLTVFVMLLVGMRAEGAQLRPSSAIHTRTGSVARRVLGVYVRREVKETPAKLESLRR
jgi:predicted LPLAT superfamily acyltransferase